MEKMDNYLLRRVSRIALIALFAMILLAGATIANAEEPKLDDDWHFTLIPYLWLPSIGGKMNINVPNTSPASSSGMQTVSTVSNDFNISSSSLLKNFKFGALVTMELEKGDWSFLTDVMYVHLSDSNRQVTFPNLPSGSFDIGADTSFRGWIVEAAPAYSLYRSQSIKFDILAGVRYIGIDSSATLDLSTTLPEEIPSHYYSYNKGLVDPIVGFKGKCELGEGWYIPYYFDAGGFDINNEWSWQAFGGVGYHFSKLYSMDLGYRHLQYNFNHSVLLKDVYMSGVLLGFVFRF